MITEKEHTKPYKNMILITLKVKDSINQCIDEKSSKSLKEYRAEIEKLKTEFRDRYMVLNQYYKKIENNKKILNALDTRSEEYLNDIDILLNQKTRKIKTGENCVGSNLIRKLNEDIYKILQAIGLLEMPN